MSIPTADQKALETQNYFQTALDKKIMEETTDTCACNTIPFDIDTRKPFAHPILNRLQGRYVEKGYNVWYQPRYVGKDAFDDDVPHRLCVSWNK